MTERAFVLIPLREIAGNLRIPGTDATLDELIARLSKEQLVQPIPTLQAKILADRRPRESFVMRCFVP
jgi:hypothetical protein